MEAEIISGYFKPRIVVSNDLGPVPMDRFLGALTRAFDGYLAALKFEGVEEEERLYDLLNTKLHIVRDRIIARQERGE